VGVYVLVDAVGQERVDRQSRRLRLPNRYVVQQHHVQGQQRNAEELAVIRGE
jgi:nanoRNase/pAp phosphatase (c-di-AMP/oligoRNAs hydrolase)